MINYVRGSQTILVLIIHSFKHSQLAQVTKLYPYDILVGESIFFSNLYFYVYIFGCMLWEQCVSLIPTHVM